MTAQTKRTRRSPSTDYSGQRHGHWTILGARRGKQIEVRCECGTVRFVDLSNVLGGGSTNCGCRKGVNRRRDIAGQRFGTLVAIKPADDLRHGRLAWKCLCDCGKEAVFTGHSLRNGNTRSCGAVVHRKDYSLTESRIAAQKKPCNKCGKILPFSAFSVRTTHHDGRYA